MSARLLTSIALLVTALPALAKPPELPVDPRVICSEPVPAPAPIVHAIEPEGSDAPIIINAEEMILINAEETRTGSLMFGLGVNSDAGLTGSTVLAHAPQAGETPVDGLWLAAAVETKQPCPYADLLLDTMLPPLRLRHLMPAKVKEVVGEWRPQITDVFEKWHDALTQHTAQSPCTRDHCPSCPYGAPRPTPQETEDPAEEEESEECHDREPPVCEEQQTSDEDDWEVQVEARIINLKTGEVIVCPKMTLLNGQPADLRIDHEKMSIHESVTVTLMTHAEPISTMPTEMEEIEAMPQEEKDGCEVKFKLMWPAPRPEVHEPATEETEPPMTEDEDPQPAPGNPCHGICPAGNCPGFRPTHEYDVPATVPTAPEPAEPEKKSVCPYMQKQAEHTNAAPVEDVFGDTVSDNLEKLIKARKIMHKAERCQEQGDLDRACELYEKVQKLCPGSRFDHEAAEHIAAIEVQQATEKAKDSEVEEADVPVPEPEAKSHDCPCKAWAKHCKHVLHTAAHCPFVKMMKVVLFCDHDCSMLAKAYLCLPEPKETTYPGCHTDDGATEETEPAPEEQAQPYDVQLKPELPPIDPKVVDALEKVLKDSPAPLKPKLIVVPEEASGAEEQEEPVSQWPLVPPEQEMPSLYVPLETEDLDIDQDDGTVSVPKTPDAEDVFRSVLDALREKMYVDVSGVDPESLETKVTLRVNGIECHLVFDGSGHRYFLVGLLPEATGDLKELQHALNERVMHWISVMNGGGNQVEAEASEVTNEDADEFSEDDDPDTE